MEKEAAKDRRPLRGSFAKLIEDSLAKTVGRAPQGHLVAHARFGNCLTFASWSTLFGQVIERVVERCLQHPDRGVPALAEGEDHLAQGARG